MGDIIRDGRDVVSFLNDLKEGLEGEEAGYGDKTMEEESHDRDGGSSDRDDGSGDRTESGSAVAKSDEPSGSSNTSVKKRGPKKKLRPDERFMITEIARDSQPIKPLRTKEAFSAQSGVLVRDIIPISIELWNEPKKEELQVFFVEDRQKDDLWKALKVNFTLSEEEDPENPVIEPLIKSCALKKMADLFNRWKNELKTTYVDQHKTPEFTGRFDKIRDHWPAFVANKTSERSKKMLAINKINAAKKEHHHRMGSGGYLKARPLWNKAEQDLIAKGVELETLHWPNCCRTWFFGDGGTLDPETGKCCWMDEQLATPVMKLRKAINKEREGKFVPDKENDELIRALGNPEHPGWTRGTPGSVPWKAGFPDAGSYKCQERRRKVEQSELQEMHARLRKLEEREAVRSKRPAEATPPTQRRSSVASTELLQLEPVFTAPASYPVDAIMEYQHCHLMTQWQSYQVKAAAGSVRPPEPDATFHIRPEGYARVMVDKITEGFEE